MIILDYRDRRPIYEQVISRFQELMLTGALEKDSQLPSVRSLAMELSINPEYDPEGLCGAGAAGIHLFHQGKRKLCGGQRPCEGSRETGSAAAAGGSG